MSKIIGIDLGTTNSVCAVIEGGEPTVIASAEGERLVSSVVAVNKNGERLTGRPAHNQAVVNPENTVFSIKRFMGRKFDDPEVQRAKDRVPYEITKAPNGDMRVVLGGKEYSAPEVSAMVLAKIRPMPKLIWARKSLKPSSPYRHISTMPSAMPPKMPVKSQAWKYYGSSTSRQLLPWLTGWTKKPMRLSRSTTCAAAPLTFPFWM